MDTSELETEVAYLRGRLDDVEAEARDLEYQRDTYADQVDDLQRQVEEALQRATIAEGALRDIDQRAKNLASAASSAAASTITAIDRLQELEPLVLAAIAWNEMPIHKYQVALNDLINQEITRRRERT